MAAWGIAKAKAQLSEIIHEAAKAGPQVLLRSGREVAIVISIDEWKCLQASAPAGTPPLPSLAEFILNSPLHGLKIPKIKWTPRKLKL